MSVLTPTLTLAETPPPDFLDDRGTGVTTSLFGTYIRGGEFLVYPFYEYAKASNAEYHGSELGFTGDIDYSGKSQVHEAILFLAYGLTDDLAFELEGELYVNETLTRSPDDTTTGMPSQIKETGLGDVEAQIRWRFSRETRTRPEFYTNLEVTFPLQKNGDVLIGTSNWEYAVGLGMVKGFDWGTLTSRISLAYEQGEGKAKFGEYAIEYLKKLSPTWRWVSAIEGEDDEVMAILEAQWHFSPRAFLKLNSGFGMTRKAEDFAPEIGVMFSF
jgi:hypothetical protein